MKSQAYRMALGGITAALAVVIMCMGTIIPIATYVCPMLAMVLLQLIFPALGKKLCWSWYAAVAVLSLLMAPDKEAAMVYGFLGFYPIIRSALNALPAGWLWKLLVFNASVLLCYWLMIHLLGMAELAQELTFWVSIVTLILGNITFLLTDRLLAMLSSGKFKRRG